MLTDKEIRQAAGKTAIARRKASLPARLLASGRRLAYRKRNYEAVFDWGCGKGVDIEYFKEMFDASDGWDPIHRPDPDPLQARRLHGGWDWVTLTYVLNVLPKQEREETLANVFRFLPSWGRAWISVRTNNSIMSAWNDGWQRYGDMFVTQSGTLQRGFEPEEVVSLALASGFSAATVVKKNPLIVVADKSDTSKLIYGATNSICPNCFGNVKIVRDVNGLFERCKCRYINETCGVRRRLSR